MSSESKIGDPRDGVVYIIERIGWRDNCGRVDARGMSDRSRYVVVVEVGGSSVQRQGSTRRLLLFCRPIRTIYQIELAEHSFLPSRLNKNIFTANSIVLHRIDFSTRN